QYRANPPKTIDGSTISFIHDYQKQETIHTLTGKKSTISQPKSDVLQFIAEDGTKVSIRPSGTEPKIKFYFGVKGQLKSASELENQLKELDAKIAKIVEELGIRK
ncbi:MAG: phospho-sugar mutase, partial [Bacteroidales bacterium]